MGRHRHGHRLPTRRLLQRWLLCLVGMGMIITTMLLLLLWRNVLMAGVHHNEVQRDLGRSVPLSSGLTQTDDWPNIEPRRQQLLPRNIIGTFNTLPVYASQYNDDGGDDNRSSSSSSSSFSCVQQRVQGGGHNNDKDNEDDAWRYTSCRYENLCWDVAAKEYVLLTDHEEETSTTSDNIIPKVSLGGINPRWDVNVRQFDRNSNKLQWAPQWRMHHRPTTNAVVGHLDDRVVLMPFHSMAGHNVGHLLWDDLFSIYCLLRAFFGGPQRPLQQQRQLLLIRQSLPSINNNHSNKNETFLYANCDIRRNKRIGCQENFVRFLPYFGVGGASTTDPKNTATTKTTTAATNTFSSTNQINVTGHVDLVCARTALAGLAYWTDHGQADHGWDYLGGTMDDEYHATTPPPPSPHNLARGKLFYEFGQYLLSHHHHRPALQQQQQQQPFHLITFSVESSRDVTRRLDFAPQIDALKQQYQNHDTIKVRAFQFRDMSVDEQMNVAASTRILVTACGGGAVTVTFLPRHASVIVFYDDTGGLDFATLQSTGRPARLDWDLLTNASHLRVHWLPIHRMNEPAYLRLFQALIAHEMALMDRIGM
jgi:hypothetical protein